MSHYHYRVATNQSQIAGQPLSFSDWVERAYGAQDPRYCDIPEMFMPQSNWLLAEGKFGPDDIIVDFVGRFEHLQRDFEHVCEVIGIEPPELPHLKKSQRGPYQDYYTEETRSIIAQLFADDIQRFAYAFD